MLKVISCIVLFASVSYTGNLLAKGVERRPYALEELYTAMDTLRTRLNYMGEPMKTALQNTALELEGDMAVVFTHASSLMGEGEPAGDALRNALLENKRAGGSLWPLNGSDIDTVHALGNRIGGDSGSQEAAFALALTALKAATEKADREKATHGRLFRAGGMLAGALLAIIFI